MSWESVVEGATSTPSEPDDHPAVLQTGPAPTAASPLTGPAPIDASIGAAPTTPVAPVAAEPPAPWSPAVDRDSYTDVAFAPISFAPLTLDPLPPAAPAAPAAPAPSAEMPSAIPSVGSTAMAPAPPASPQPPLLRAAPFEPIVPAFGEEAGTGSPPASPQAVVPAPPSTASVEVPVVASVEVPVVASSEFQSVASVEFQSVASSEFQPVTPVSPSTASVEVPAVASTEFPVVASVEVPVVASVEVPVVASSEFQSVASSEFQSVASSEFQSVASVEVPVVASSELPVIVEATPVVATPPFGSSVLAPDPIGAGPQLPQVQQQPARLQTAAVVQEYSAPPALATSTATPRRKSRRGLKLVLTLVVLAGLVAAGVVFGRPYLSPSDWDATAEPYAATVQAVRGVGYREPITVSAEPTTDFTLRLVGEFAPDWNDDEAMWRSLGLLNGAASQAKVAELLAGWQDAMYSTTDGQVYHDAAATTPQVEAAITASMAAASLDQQYGWSPDQRSRTTDDRVLTLAEVQRQARAVVAASAFAVPADPADPAVLAFVPPVVGYRALAPMSFAEFGTASTDPANALSSIGTAGPGPLASETLVPAPNPTMVGGDTQLSSPRPLDRSFWYLVLAGYLDSGTAYRASEAIVENAISMADRAGTSCVYATFAGGDVDGTATLRSALESWSAAAPAEFGATLAVLDDGTLQLVSCDPGAGFENSSRLGVARELVVWRSVELATIEALSGTELDRATTWAFVESSNVASDLIALPADTSPASMAAAARAGVAAVITPAG